MGTKAIDPRAAAVHRMVRSAIASGALNRPDVCSECGARAIGAKGQSLIHGHHDDYGRPLDVRWLCAKCHRAVTPFSEDAGTPVFGETNGAAKLNESQVAEIKASQHGCVILARKYGVNKTTIFRIQSGRYWPHVSPAPGERSK